MRVSVFQSTLHVPHESPRSAVDDVSVVLSVVQSVESGLLDVVLEDLVLLPPLLGDPGLEGAPALVLLSLGPVDQNPTESPVAAVGRGRLLLHLAFSFGDLAHESACVGHGLGLENTVFTHELLRTACLAQESLAAVAQVKLVSQVAGSGGVSGDGVVLPIGSLWFVNAPLVLPVGLDCAPAFVFLIGHHDEIDVVVQLNTVVDFVGCGVQHASGLGFCQLRLDKNGRHFFENDDQLSGLRTDSRNDRRLQNGQPDD